MADEQRLKDAKIQVKLDLKGAQDALDDLNKDGDRSTPGGRPPSPGRKDDRKRREDDERKAKQRPRAAAVGAAVGVAKIPGAIVAVVKTVVAASVATLVAEIVPAMISARLAQVKDDISFERGVLEIMEVAVGMPLQALGQLVRNLENTLAVGGAFVGTALDVAVSQKSLIGEADAEDVFSIAGRAAMVASAQRSLAGSRRHQRRIIFGGAIVDIADDIKDLMFKGSETNR